MSKVISILQPWASLVVLGHKKIETRSWNTKYRGELLIHASARKIKVDECTYNLWGHLSKVMSSDEYLKLPYGAVIGKVNLVDVIESELVMDDRSEGYYIERNCRSYEWVFTEQELAFGDYSPNRYCWLLSDPVLFDKPIPAKGQLGIWNWE